MKLVSRRDLVKGVAALPFAASLESFANPTTSVLPASKHYNVVLHGLFVVQNQSPRDPHLMRLIFPSVSGRDHKHVYRQGDPKGDHHKDHDLSKGYLMYCTRPAGSGIPKRDQFVVLPDRSFHIPTSDADLLKVASCWLDLPRPSCFIPLRSRDTSKCGIGFAGSVGNQIDPSSVPAVTLLQYDVPDNGAMVSDLPLPLSAEYTLVLRSEPEHVVAGEDDSAALDAARSCLRLSKDEFDITLVGRGCDLPPAKSEFGVTDYDEKTLSELNGGSRGVQPRACMTLLAGEF